MVKSHWHLQNCCLRERFAKKEWVKSMISTVHWKLENISPTIFSQKFRQSNFFTKELYCKLISRKLFEMWENLRNYHTALCTLKFIRISVKSYVPIYICSVSWFHEIFFKREKNSETILTKKDKSRYHNLVAWEVVIVTTYRL